MAFINYRIYRFTISLKTKSKKDYLEILEECISLRLKTDRQSNVMRLLVAKGKGLLASSEPGKMLQEGLHPYRQRNLLYGSYSCRSVRQMGTQQFWPLQRPGTELREMQKQAQQIKAESGPGASP